MRHHQLYCLYNKKQSPYFCCICLVIWNTYRQEGKFNIPKRKMINRIATNFSFFHQRHKSGMLRWCQDSIMKCATRKGENDLSRKNISGCIISSRYRNYVYYSFFFDRLFTLIPLQQRQKNPLAEFHSEDTHAVEWAIRSKLIQRCTS